MNLLLKLDDVSISKAEETDRQLRVIEKQSNNVRLKTLSSIALLESVINKTIPNNARELKNDFASLKHQFYLLNEAFQSFKKDLFSVTENSLKSEKLKHLLTV